MAFTYYNKAETVSSAANPVTVGVATNTYTTVAVLCIMTVGSTARAGGAPTYFGETMTQAGTTESCTEGKVEVWYLLNDLITKSTGGTFSVPNSGTITMTLVASVYDSPDATKWAYFGIVDQASSDTTSTATVTVGTYVDPAVIVGGLFTGYDSAGFMTLNRTVLYSGDTGSEGYGAQYYLETSGFGTIALSATPNMPNWAWVGAAFTERDAVDIVSIDTVIYGHIDSHDTVKRDNIASHDTVLTNN